MMFLRYVSTPRNMKDCVIILFQLISYLMSLSLDDFMLERFLIQEC